MDTLNTKEEKKNRSALKVIAIIIIVLIIVPLTILSLIYRSNTSFKNNTNKFLSKIPGFVGEHFRNLPTEGEKNEKISYLSNYFLSLDPSIAADKIYIVKKDDEKLYMDLIKDMNSISVSKTEEIVIKVRNMELRKDLLFSIYEDAQRDENEKFLAEVSRIENRMFSLL